MGAIPSRASNNADDSTHADEYGELLLHGMRNLEDQGLGLPLQLSLLVEVYIERAQRQGWFHAPQASAMQVRLSRLVRAYGRMETIRLTPMPVALL